MAALRDEIATIDELAAIMGSREAAEKLLAAHGVPTSGGLFSRELFRSSVLGTPRATMEASMGGDLASRGLTVLEGALQAYGLEVVGVARGRALTVSIVAPNRPREIVGVDQEHLERLRIDRTQLNARVYIASAPRSGTPQFTASGFLLDRTPKVFFYVTASPPHVWVTTRADLRSLYADLGARAKRDRRFGDAQYGFARNPQRAGTLRITMPRGSRTGLDLSERIADEKGRIIGTPPVPP
jgi:hypothetical protein